MGKINRMTVEDKINCFVLRTDYQLTYREIAEWMTSDGRRFTSQALHAMMQNTTNVAVTDGVIMAYLEDNSAADEAKSMTSDDKLRCFTLLVADNCVYTEAAEIMAKEGRMFTPQALYAMMLNATDGGAKRDRIHNRKLRRWLFENRKTEADLAGACGVDKPVMDAALHGANNYIPVAIAEKILAVTGLDLGRPASKG